jgi:hypothetical protein
MMRVRVTFFHAAEARRVLADELRRGVMLVKIEAPESLEFRAKIAVEIASDLGAMEIASEVVSILPSVGIAIAFPVERLEEARGLLASLPETPAREADHEVVEAVPPAGSAPAGAGAATDAPPSNAAPGAVQRLSHAEKVQLALHGSRDDRAAILRDQNKQLHPFVLKAPNVTPDEIAGWAANPQMSADFLKQIAERKEWISRPAIATALARNPKTPAEVAVRAVDYVPAEALRQWAKGVGALPHVVQAARRKILPR